jgi:hypothetical protein
MHALFENISKYIEHKYSLVILLGCSAAIKLLAFIIYFDTVINPDGLVYITVAQHFTDGFFKEGLAIHAMPLYPLLLSLLHYIIPNWITAARLFSIAASVLTLIPLYYLVNDLFNRRAAFWSSLAFSLTPVSNDLSMQVVRDPVFVFLFALAVFYAQRSIQSRKTIHFIAAALISGFSILLRLEGVVIFPTVLLFLIFMIWWDSENRHSYLIGFIIWLAFPVIVAVILSILLGAEATGLNRMDRIALELKNLFNLKFLDNYHLLYGELKHLAYTSSYSGGGKLNLYAITRHNMPLIYLWGLFLGFIKIIFPLFVIPIFWSFRKSFRPHHFGVILLLGAYLFGYYYILIVRDFIPRRVLFIPSLLVYPWIGFGLARLFEYTTPPGTPKKVVAAIFIFILTVSPVWKFMQKMGKKDFVIPVAGKWLANHSDFKNAKIITNDGRLLFYSNRKLTDIGSGVLLGSQSGDMTYPIYKNDYSIIEKKATQNRMDVMAVVVGFKRKNLIPELENYKRFKEFTGKKESVILYSSPGFMKYLNRRDSG